MPQERSYKIDAINVMDLGGYIAESKPHNQLIHRIAGHARLPLIASLYQIKDQK
jgi:hypothetical protein